MPIDRRLQKVLDEYAAFGAPPIHTLSPQEARQQPTLADAVKALLQKEGQDSAPEPVGDVENQVIPAGNTIPVRIYRPGSQRPYPVLIYFHGGGWVIADLDTYDASCRALTNMAQCIVVSVAYRQAPEQLF